MDASKLIFRDNLLAQERILVTGGATGLGREMTEAFLALGAQVVICGRRAEALEAAERQLKGQHGARIIAKVCDIRSEDAIHTMLDDIWREAPLTGLVNNAAGNFVSRTEDLSAKGFDAIANTVFRGTFLMTQSIGKRWIAEQRGGTILSILATFVWNGSPFTVPSAMSKAGLNAMTQSLAVEWARHGIRCNAICPGPFPTEGAWKHLSPRADHASATAPHVAANPMGRIGEMHELCNLAVMLVGPGTSFLNGETIAIDGAARLATPRSLRLVGWGEQQWQDARTAIRETDARERGSRGPLVEG